MHQLMRIACLCLSASLWGMVSDASAQYINIFGLSSQPSPFGENQSVNMTFYVGFDNPYGGWYIASAVCVEVIQDQAGTISATCDYPGENQEVVGGSASDTPNRSASSQFKPWVEYYDYEMGQYHWVEGSSSWHTVNYDPNYLPCNGDTRYQMTLEYQNGGDGYPPVNYNPPCTAFVTSGSAGRFTWSMVNQQPGSGHYPYGLFTSFTQLNRTQTYWGSGSAKYITVQSGYRCPHGNNLVGGKDQSRHMWGDAVDMTVYPWSYTIRNSLESKARTAGFRWFEPWGDCDGCTVTHLHADRR